MVTFAPRGVSASTMSLSTEKGFGGSADSEKPNIEQASLASGQISSIDLANYYEENAGSESRFTLLRVHGS